jgi:aspartyl-tRNA(Asn)/glutamyl-tRNA(Gln) amidotransferase subunit A
LKQQASRIQEQEAYGMHLHEETIHGLHVKLKRREVSSEEVTRSLLERISQLNSEVNAYITVTEKEALEQAKEADRRLAEGEVPSALCGVPLAIKDVMNTRGVRTTCASRMLEHFVPPFDGTAVRKLREAGAVFLGKTNMDEFAMGSSNEHSCFGPCRNPYDRDRVTGGSSGGSVCAVAMDMCIAATGSDTGGSIRQPAAYCGVVGMKPTYGRVSRFGLVAFASSLDQIGPIAKDVTDCSLLLEALCGYDPLDSTSVDLPVPSFSSALTGEVRGMRIGIPKEYFIEGMDAEVEEAVRNGIRIFEKEGALPVEISLPHTSYGIPVYYLIATAEASSNLARYDGVKYGYRAMGASDTLRQMYHRTRSQGFGTEVKRRIMLGTYALSSGYYDAYYRKAQQVRTLIRQDFMEAFQHCDVIVTPTVPGPACRIGEKTGDPLQMYLLDIFTTTVNLAGLPGLSMPCGYTAEGLPVGMQLLGKHFDEETVLKAAFAFERETSSMRRKPPDRQGVA